MSTHLLRRSIAGLLLGGGVLGFGGCALTLAYDDFGDQKTGSANDAGCVPKTCESEGANCGELFDGCGVSLQCGDCPTGETCGGGGQNKCGAGPCTPTTCAEQSAFCGSISDGCDKTLECGTCAEPKVCSEDNKCFCLGAQTCEQLQAKCGLIDDGCGGTTLCGTCPAGQVCSGSVDDPGNAGNTAKQCVACPASCAAVNAECGNLQTCTGTVYCGDCPGGLPCGIDVGEPNICAGV